MIHHLRNWHRRRQERKFHRDMGRLTAKCGLEIAELLRLLKEFRA